jgi:tripartite-type tricarboxylate transporter receptor subunit TctC
MAFPRLSVCFDLRDETSPNGNGSHPVGSQLAISGRDFRPQGLSRGNLHVLNRPTVPAIEKKMDGRCLSDCCRLGCATEVRRTSVLHPPVGRSKNPGEVLKMQNLLRGAAVALVALVPALSSPAAAQDYPSRSVKIIVPFGAGGPADVFARQVAHALQEQLKQSFVVEDRPGGGSIIGTHEVAKSAPDGYTLLMMSNTHTVNESLKPDKPFKLMDDFVPIAGVNSSDLVMVVHPSVPAKNLKEFIALAKKEPGKLNYGSSGPGTPYHMAAELFKAMTKTDIVHVPHKASGEMRSAVIGGHVQMVFDAITTMAENVKSGQVRALGTSSAKRSSVLPNVPTIAEAGVPGYESTIWLGIMAPKGTPKAVVDKLNAAVNQAINRPEVLAAWNKQGAVPMVMTPAEFGAFLRKDIDKWAKVVETAGLAPKKK